MKIVILVRIGFQRDAGVVLATADRRFFTLLAGSNVTLSMPRRQ
jgi:hypothetical protein